MSKLPSWHFREMDPGEMHVDPVHDEFFKMQDLADALVRESIQNSLDARRPRATVRVRFRFGVDRDALPAEAARHYFMGLREHLEAVSSSIHSVIPKEDESVPYLLIEDFGTRGLTGDPRIDPELTDDTETKNDFFYFWRNVGRSNKAELDRGRWGLGKAVFSVASRIRTIFGLTRRADDKRALLLGQSVLKTHILGGTRIYPYGFFARFEKRDGLPLPIEDPMLLERFADDFRLHRTEPGLSVVVPYFRDDELSVDRLVESSIRQYFYPIIRGELTIDVEAGARKESLNARTIDTLASRPEIQRLCALTRWSLTEAERIELGETKSKWEDDILPAPLLDKLRDRFERGDRIALRVPMLVQRKKSRPAKTFFDIYLERDEALRRGEHHFIRRGITIPEVNSRTSQEKPIRALIVIDDDALSTFLGDAENPAHSDWSERADKLRTLYEKHGTTLRFVKGSAAFLSSLLTRPPEGRARDFLEDIFSIEAVDQESDWSGPARAAMKKSGESAEGAGPIGKTSDRSLTISRVAGGFTINGAGKDARVSQPMIAEMAYRVRTGNPFRKHSPFDFDLARGDVSIESEGATVKHKDVNAVQFTPTKPKFQITLKGFDSRRDLVVRVISPAEAGATSVEGDDAPETELY